MMRHSLVQDDQSRPTPVKGRCWKQREKTHCDKGLPQPWPTWQGSQEPILSIRVGCPVSCQAGSLHPCLAQDLKEVCGLWWRPSQRSWELEVLCWPHTLHLGYTLSWGGSGRCSPKATMEWFRLGKTWGTSTKCRGFLTLTSNCNKTLLRQGVWYCGYVRKGPYLLVISLSIYGGIIRCLAKQ